VRASTDYDPGWRVGIVVDSELDALTEWNARTRPLYGDALLPVNFGLVYASADKRRDSQLNNIMSCCDRLASDMMDKVSEAPADGNFELAAVGAGCSAWRLWSVVQAGNQTTLTSIPWSARLNSSFQLPRLPRSFRSRYAERAAADCCPSWRANSVRN